MHSCAILYFSVRCEVRWLMWLHFSLLESLKSIKVMKEVFYVWFLLSIMNQLHHISQGRDTGGNLISFTLSN